MFDPHMRQTLERLQREVDDMPPTSEESQTILNTLRRHLQHTLDQGDRDPGLLDSLREAVEHFEETHPTLTNTLSAAINVLSTGGV